MRNELNQIEVIEKYLSGQMTPAERTDFESKMNADPALQHDVSLQKDLIDRLRFLAFKNEMISSHKALVNFHLPWWKRPFFLNSFMILLVVGLLVGLELTFGDSFRPENNSIKPTIQAHPTSSDETQLVIHSDETDSIQSIPTNSSFSKKTKPVTTPFKDFIQPFETATLIAQTGGTIHMKNSGSLIHFPPNIFMDSTGNNVRGPVEIRYREFRNSAEMAFSKIPMTYTENSVEYLFNSAGMFEIRAFQNDQELHLKPNTSFTVDYNVTETLDSCFFFALNEDSGEWDKLRKIEYTSTQNSFGQNGPKENEFPLNQSEIKIKNGALVIVLAGRGDIREAPYFSLTLIPENDSISPDLYSYKVKGDYRNEYKIGDIKPGFYRAEIESEYYIPLTIPGIQIYPNKLSQLTVSLRSNEHKIYKAVQRGFLKLFNRKNRAGGPVKSTASTFELADSIADLTVWVDTISNQNLRNPTNSAMAFNGGTQARQTTYSKLVPGLSCPSFGVYNCDQIYRTNAMVVIKANYRNAGGKLITNEGMLTLIDLNYNGAFSSSPPLFKCNPTGKIVLLLFTQNEELFVLPAEKFDEMNLDQSGNYTFEMTNMTNSIRSTEDLKTYLGL